MVNSIFDRNYNYKHPRINLRLFGYLTAKFANISLSMFYFILFNRNFAMIGAKFANFSAFRSRSQAKFSEA
jgi:hypothetical protein